MGLAGYQCRRRRWSINVAGRLVDVQTFSFTVITDGADIMTDESYKTLLNAGCDDATIGSANGVQYIHFDRDAETLGEAIVSAINAVESVKGVNVIDVNTSDDSVRRPRVPKESYNEALDSIMAVRRQIRSGTVPRDVVLGLLSPAGPEPV